MRLLLSLALLPCLALGQSDFVPELTFKAPPASLLNDLKQRSDAEWATVKVPAEADKDYVKSAYDKEFGILLYRLNDHHLAVNSHVSEYLQELANRIRTDSRIPDKNLRVYAYRSDAYNAMSLGTGVIAVMLGLLPRLETEDQVAFVLCHELAHIVARHNLRSIYKESAVFKENLDPKEKSQRTKNILYKDARGFLEDARNGYIRHTRAFEYEADSLGLVFYLNSGFDPQQALRTLEVLDSVDSDPYETIDMRKFFNVPDSKSAMYSDVAKIRSNNPDTVTHPDCKRRKEALKRQLSRMNTLPASYPHRPNKVALAAGLELVNSEYLVKNFGVSLYHSIYLSHRFPKSYYLVSMVGQNLYEIYTLQAKHKLGTTLPQPDPRFPESYSDVLSRVHRIRIKDLADVTYQFMVTQPEAAFEDEHFLFGLWKVSQLPGSQLDYESVKEDYRQKFPSGIYSNYLH